MVFVGFYCFFHWFVVCFSWCFMMFHGFSISFSRIPYVSEIRKNTYPLGGSMIVSNRGSD